MEFNYESIKYYGKPKTNGNSSNLLKTVLEGIKANCVDIDSVSLHNLDIKSCTNCDVCRSDS